MVTISGVNYITNYHYIYYKLITSTCWLAIAYHMLWSKRVSREAMLSPYIFLLIWRIKEYSRSIMYITMLWWTIDVLWCSKRF